jgi:Xaa-Pro aminopeptidase
MNSINKEFFAHNRKRLSEALPNTLIVIPAHHTMQYSADQAYPFRQDSSFWYFTGINEHDLIFVLDTTKNEATIILSEISDYQKSWDGDLDFDEIKQSSGINKFESRKNLNKIVIQAKKQNKLIGYLKPLDEIVQPYGFYSNPARRKLELYLKKVSIDLVDCRLAIAKLRQIKQPVEVDMIKCAIEITGESLSLVKSEIANLGSETEVQRRLTTEFYAKGAEGHGYEPIVASSGNAAIIHYNKNNKPIQNNSLLLLDVGARYAGYSADISRTWAVGKPSERQNDIYTAVLELQDRAISMLKPGVLLKEYQLEMEKLIKVQMRRLNCSNAEEKYPHGISHFLGLDVHDAGDYDHPLQTGAVLTVEPGIYLTDEGIGVRIEDNIVITESGNDVLSRSISRDL